MLLRIVPGVKKTGVLLDGAANHGVSEALYLSDGNGVELYWDRPREEWPRSADGELAMFTPAVGFEGVAGRC